VPKGPSKLTSHVRHTAFLIAANISPSRLSFLNAARSRHHDDFVADRLNNRGFCPDPASGISDSKKPQCVSVRRRLTLSGPAPAMRHQHDVLDRGRVTYGFNLPMASIYRTVDFALSFDGRVPITTAARPGSGAHTRRQDAAAPRAEEGRPRGVQFLWSGHSMIWSARASSDGGIVRPRALAVLRLMASSKWIGCSTGISAGLPPRSTRTTSRAS
jgi:hypothetical protein